MKGLLLKGIVPAGLDNLAEEDLGGEGEAVVDDRLAILPVPTVHYSYLVILMPLITVKMTLMMTVMLTLHTATALFESVDVSVNTAVTAQLVASEIPEHQEEREGERMKEAFGQSIFF